MNSYICYYKGRTKEVYAETLNEAKDQAVTQFKAKKSWEVSAHLCEVDSKEVVQVVS